MRRLALLLVLSPLAVLGSSVASADARVDRWLAQGIEALDQGRHRQGRRLLRRCVSRDPTDARAIAAALPLLRRDRPQASDARWVIEAAPETTPRDADERRGVGKALAWSHLLLGDVATAIRTMPSGLQDRDGAMSLRFLAARAVEIGRLDLAEAALERARRSYPQDTAIGQDLAAVFVAQGRPRRAVRLLHELLQIRPGDHDLRVDLAGSLLATGRGSEALHLYAELADEGEDADIFRHTEAALQLGEPALAEQSVRRAAPSPAQSTLLGLALLAQGRREEAKAALRLAPDETRARQALQALENAGGV
ncbi:MAG: tetratricopeptide repeat protein [Myxococcota bacterium]